MADHVFSTARLRGYRVLQEAGLGDAVSLQVLNAVLAGRLWLPFSLIEIAFRNAADRAVTVAHPAGEDWLISAGRSGALLVAAEVASPPAFHRARHDGSEDDPVADAARMAARQLGREEVSRDDLIAHLMLGFWVRRCVGALAVEPGLDLWALIADELEPPLDDGPRLEKVMSQVLRMRDRVAHHEALLFRAKHVFDRDGEPKAGLDLITSVESAIQSFTKDVELAVETAKTMAAPALKFLEAVPDTIRAEIAAFEAALAAERLHQREARDAAKAARKAERAARHSSSE